MLLVGRASRFDEISTSSFESTSCLGYNEDMKRWNLEILMNGTDEQ